MSDDQHRSVSYRKKALPELLWRPILEPQRQRMYERFVELFPPSPNRRIVNVGVNGSYAEPEKHFLESRYPYRDNIVACGIPDRPVTSVAQVLGEDVDLEMAQYSLAYQFGKGMGFGMVEAEEGALELEILEQPQPSQIIFTPASSG